MSIQGYEQGVDGSRVDENWTEDIAKSQGRITDTGLYPYSSANYIVFRVGSTYYGRNGVTGVVDQSNGSALTLLQAVVDALPDANAGIIQVVPHSSGLAFDGTLTLQDKNYLTIQTGYGIPSSWSGSVRIKKIAYESTTGVLNGLRLQGLLLEELELNGNGGAIQDVAVYDCMLWASQYYHGLVTLGANYVDYVRLTNCKFATNYGARTEGLGFGLVTFGNTASGTGQYYFDGCTFDIWNPSANGDIFHLRSNSKCDFTALNKCSIVVETGATVTRVIDLLSDSGTSVFNLVMGDCNPIELHADATMTHISNPTTGSIHHSVDVHDTFFTLDAYDLTLLSNSATNTDWLNATNYRANQVAYHHNIFTYLSTGSVVVGTLGEVARFTTLFQDNRNLNPLNTIATPFDTTNDLIVLQGGGAATPSASTDYVVRGCDYIVVSGDSGNADCNLLLKDGAGNTVATIGTPSASTTIFAPRNYQLNWGAYTGAAPTVVVSAL